MSKISNFFIASPKNNYRPAVLSYKAFLIYGFILLILRLWFATLPTQSAAVESNLLMRLIDGERVNRGLTGLLTHPALVTASAQKSQDMIDRDYFSHVDPDGNYVWPKIVNAGYRPYQILGENLAIDFSTSEGMIKAWLDSPTHRANLLHEEFVHQGLTALYGDFEGRYTNLTASLFGALAGSYKPATEAKTVTPPQKTEGKTTIPPEQKQIPENEPEKTIETPIKPVSGEPKKFPLGFPSKLEDISTRATYPLPFLLSRFVFTIFGILLLIILSADAVIINQHELLVARSYSSYHLMNLFLIVVISILIWWW